MNTKTYRENCKNWTLPEYLQFSDCGQIFGGFGKQMFYYKYNVLGFREPKKDEWFLSGAITEAYYAPNDISDEFLVVEPINVPFKQTYTILKA